jgi:hypothetical protein
MPSQKTTVAQAAQKYSIHPGILEDLYGIEERPSVTRKPVGAIRLRKVHRPQRLGDELSHLVASGAIRGVDTFKKDLERLVKQIKPTTPHQRYRIELLRVAASHPHVLGNAPQIVRHGMEHAERENR